jgi:formylglycine-generating enzyme
MRAPLAFPLCLVLSFGISASASASVVIDWVTIGNPGNLAQSLNNRTHIIRTTGDGSGSVSYVYTMARNETSIADYTKFLNAVAATDTYGLYDIRMASNLNIAGISRSGSSGSFSYSVVGSGDRPITYVSWFDAARFANWLHHGQPTGLLGVGLIEDGAYLLSGATSGTAPQKNADAKVWIPTNNEWFKAAYYDPAHINGAGGYWLHANRSSSTQSNDFSVAGAANFRVGDFATTPGNNTLLTNQNYLTAAGAYGQDSQSYYGINDMAGNVYEWNDLTGTASASRGYRGGAWDITNSASLDSASQAFNNTNFAASNLGFRLAAVPEPSTMFLTLCFGSAVVCRRKR